MSASACLNAACSLGPGTVPEAAEMTAETSQVARCA